MLGPCDLRLKIAASRDALNTVGVHVHEFVPFEQRFHLWPYACEQRMEFPPAQISKSEMNHPRRRRMHDDPFREIRIFGDNYQMTISGELPQLGICRADPNCRG